MNGVNTALLGGPGLILFGLAVLAMAHNGRPAKRQRTPIVVCLVSGPSLVALAIVSTVVGWWVT